MRGQIIYQCFTFDLQMAYVSLWNFACAWQTFIYFLFFAKFYISLWKFAFACWMFVFLAKFLCSQRNCILWENIKLVLEILWSWRENYRLNVLANECRVSWENTIFTFCERMERFCKLLPKDLNIFLFFFFITVFIVNSENWSLN